MFDVLLNLGGTPLTTLHGHRCGDLIGLFQHGGLKYAPVCGDKHVDLNPNGPEGKMIGYIVVRSAKSPFRENFGLKQSTLSNERAQLFECLKKLVCLASEYLSFRVSCPHI